MQIDRLTPPDQKTVASADGRKQDVKQFTPIIDDQVQPETEKPTEGWNPQSECC